jgi:hypothetical protein
MLDNKGKAWTPIDESHLLRMCNVEKLKILDIVKTLKRTVYAIVCRLKHLGIIPQQMLITDVRGYNEYIHNTDYRETAKFENRTQNITTPSSTEVIYTSNEYGTLGDAVKSIPNTIVPQQYIDQDLLTISSSDRYDNAKLMYGEYEIEHHRNLEWI